MVVVVILPTLSITNGRGDGGMKIGTGGMAFSAALVTAVITVVTAIIHTIETATTMLIVESSCYC